MTGGQKVWSLNILD